MATVTDTYIIRLKKEHNELQAQYEALARDLQQKELLKFEDEADRRLRLNYPSREHQYFESRITILRKAIISLNNKEG